MNATTTLKWLRFNLFAKPFDTGLTLVVLPTLAWIAWSFGQWAVATADWNVVRSSLKVLMVGVFPGDQIWRTWVAAASLAALLGIALATTLPFRPSRLPVLLALMAVVAALGFSVSPGTSVKAVVIVGAFAAAWLIATRFHAVSSNIGKLATALLAIVVLVLVPAGSANWGGLLLSVILTIFSAALTIPLGILLAFGRQSRIGSIRTLCTGYIELMRAVPLILIVYLIWVSVPLLFPSWQVSDVLRGLVGFVAFYSAYAAEYIRSGLQAVPRGQVEAAESLGFSDNDVKRMIVLPQAMRVALPGLVGNTLDIFNYAPLVFIIGLTDFLRAGQMILANPQNSGNVYEVYVFLFIVYFAIGSTITFLARRMERHLARGASR